MENEILTLDEIKKQFPDEWILLNVSNKSQLPDNKGIVLWHGKDYLELCYKGSEIAKDILTKTIYTGEQQTSRKWLKATRLKEQAQTI